ncbi:type VII toxin-antitoxin system HepT family RNase toxin [Halovivax gelatinilyticus]|uniref:type VII toxin-antitoxin system HepT family RNase toxin n=1 Tax=Halovivax gelatinilyticus TaxID=2961597 RepID=UPI0020CA4325|nr:DUF86 domain-containing protein [Halovivax gelatinilyticus]
MADERVVSTKLEQIEQYHDELRTKRRTLSRAEFLESITEQRAVERMFENAIQACSDLAQHVATHDCSYDESASKGAIFVLARNDVIEDGTAETLISAVGFRNVLAHEYGLVDPEVVYETLQTGLAVYEEFSEQIARWYREQSTSN